MHNSICFFKSHAILHKIKGNFFIETFKLLKTKLEYLDKSFLQFHAELNVGVLFYCNFPTRVTKQLLHFTPHKGSL